MGSSAVPPPPPVVEHCYRHPSVETGVHCTRCGRPICTDCMLPAAVGHQCPECVKEAKQEFVRPARNPSTRVGRGLTATNVLLVIMVAVFGLELVLGGPGSLLTGPSGSILVRLGANVGLWQSDNGCLIGIGAGQYWRLFTPIFLHAGLIHIAFNGYALYIVGNVVEEELGWRRFLAIFFVTGRLRLGRELRVRRVLRCRASARRGRSTGCSARSSPTTGDGAHRRSTRRACGRWRP